MFVSLHLYAEALELFTSMRQAQVEPDAVAYGGVLAACGKAGKADEALATWAEVQRSAAEPTSGMLSSVVGACDKAGQW